MTNTRRAILAALEETDAGKSVHLTWSRWQCSACSDVIERPGLDKPDRKCLCRKGRWKRCTVGSIKIAETDVAPAA